MLDGSCNINIPYQWYRTAYHVPLWDLLNTIANIHDIPGELSSIYTRRTEYGWRSLNARHTEW